ncbi:HNH endonuclease, partial [Burkholderia multivorans]
MRTTAGLFLDEVIEHLRLLNPRPDEPYAHASFIDTAHRYEVPESDELEGPSNSGASAEAVTDEGESANSDGRTDEAESSNADGPTDASPDEAAVGAAGEAAVSAAGLGGAGLGADSPEPEHLPGFPRFRPDSTFYT